jgi:transposase
MKVDGRSVICEECNWRRDRDHNAATNMSNGVLQFLQEGQWPVPLDYERAKFIGSSNDSDANDA